MSTYKAVGDVTLVPDENHRHLFSGTPGKGQTVDGDYVDPDSLQDALNKGLLVQES